MSKKLLLELHNQFKGRVLKKAEMFSDDNDVRARTSHGNTIHDVRFVLFCHTYDMNAFASLWQVPRAHHCCLIYVPNEALFPITENWEADFSTSWIQPSINKPMQAFPEQGTRHHLLEPALDIPTWLDLTWRSPKLMRLAFCGSKLGHDLGDWRAEQ